MRKIYYILLVGILLSMSVRVNAQSTEQDWVTTQAYIDFHKKISTMLLTRSALEELAKHSHTYTQAQSLDYKHVSFQLDKYDKCFAFMDALLRTTATVGNAVYTYNDVRRRLSEYTTLVNEYKDKCLKRGDIVSSDSVIITISVRVVNDVVKLTNELYRSVVTSQFYLTGVYHCTPVMYMEVIGMINDYMDNVRKVVNDAYMFLWRYIFNRTHYWSKSLDQAKTSDEMIRDALQRWIDNAKSASGR